MAETKVCEQCQVEKGIECFYRRPQKHDPNKRMKICIDCYKQNLAESKRRQEEWYRQRQEEERQRQAQQEAERLAREQALQARALELSIQANKRCPRCKQVQTNGVLWIWNNNEEHFHFPRYCQACIDATPHQVYRLICPLFKQTRYIGITSQPPKKRLAGHMRNDGGTEQKRAWIEKLRARNLTAQIEVIDTAPNEQEALKAEQAWIDHHIRLGCPLTNSEVVSEVRTAQHVLDLQNGRVLSPEEKVSNLYCSSRDFRRKCATARMFQIARWRNRTHYAYFLDTAYTPDISFMIHRSNAKAQEYDHVIFEHDLPEDRLERNAVLSNVTIAYLRWDETLFLWQTKRKCEDIRYLLDRHIPLICTRLEKDYTHTTGFVTGLTQENIPIIHPFTYSVDSTRAIVVARPCSESDLSADEILT